MQADLVEARLQIQFTEDLGLPDALYELLAARQRVRLPYGLVIDGSEVPADPGVSPQPCHCVLLLGEGALRLGCGGTEGLLHQARSHQLVGLLLQELDVLRVMASAGRLAWRGSAADPEGSCSAVIARQVGHAV